MVLLGLPILAVLLAEKHALAGKPDPVKGALYNASSDADADGVPDALDTCPSGAIRPKPAARSRLPACYLGSTGSTYGQGPPLTGLSTVHQYGAWFQANGCVPAMAFPVDDVRADGSRSVGVVIVGTGTRLQDPVLTAAAAGLPWPSDSDAACAISIDYASPSPLRVIEFPDPAVPNFYVHWNPKLKTPSAGSSDQFIPSDGIGLFVAADGVAAPSVRYTVRSKTKGTVRHHFRLTRGAIWASNLDPAPPWKCPASTSTPRPYRDPVRPIDFPVFTKTCGDPSVIQFAKPSFTLVPSGFDDALFSERKSELDAFTTTYTLPDPIIDAVEGLPSSYVADDRYWDEVTPRPTFLLASTTTAYFAPKSYKGTNTSSDPWLLVPASIARTNQHQVAYTPPGVPKPSSPYLRPVGPAEYSKSGGGDIPGTRLAFQKFNSSDGTYGRTVETLWPHATPSMATSERHPKFGHRWTTNAARPDCWTPDATGGFVGFPLRSNIGPNADAVAEAWCPASLSDWTDEEAVDEFGTATHSQTDAHALCQSFIDVQDDLATVGKVYISSCTVATVSVIVAEAACCASTAWVGVGVACCIAQAATVIASPQIVTECATPLTMNWTRDNFVNDSHWRSRSTSNHRLVPMYSMVRAQANPAEDKWLTTTKNLVAAGDGMNNRAHQGSDWNWDVAPRSVDVMDPGYARIATRDGTDFRGIENELEFQVPMGAWSQNQHGEADYDRHGHTGYEYLWNAISGNGVNAQALGEIWPNEFCDLFGFDVDNYTKQDALSWPTKSCGNLRHGDYWRNHYGRGIFFPIVAGRDPVGMAVDPNFRGNQKYDIPTTVPIGVEDWTSRGLPHRLGFLGAPIVDCGHDPYRIEIHPPHVLTYESACDSAPDGSCKGLTVVAFGWANAVSPPTMEFDVWPPPRPSATSVFVSKGERTKLSAPSEQFGYVIDGSGLQAGDRSTLASQPKLQCFAAPVAHPNHVHCTYNDPAAGKVTPSFDQLRHDNPRMAPKWATSRFETRFYLGWR